jgi:ubiquinone/menaquinone biosynthesis C-methylase UbiE
MIPDWQLPAGTDRGLWDYVSSERVAREYDAALAGTPLLELDLQFAERHFQTPGKLVDLGCGTGRLLFHFARRGSACVGVDLSQAMLDVIREKSQREGLSIELRKANLVELEQFAASEFDHAACLFSTLGMIRGRENRRRFLSHVRRILEPGGTFVVHAHNANYRGVRGLIRGNEPGDRTMPQNRGGADLTIHHYTLRELREELEAAGFRIREIAPVSTSPDGRVRASWFFGKRRTYGYLVACESQVV